MTCYEVGNSAKEAKVQKLILTHLPPSGEWEKLLGEAKEAAGDVVVQLAEKDLQIII